MTSAGGKKKIAVVLFNLGGPDGPDAVRPFLFNLFRDPAIIGLPAPLRYPIAALISTTRTKLAKENYALMGGGSPLLPETEKQARALEADLADRFPDAETRCFIAMRYWKPLTNETAKAVKAFAPDEVVLLPLYPQYSSTTTGSSLKAWKRAGRKGPGRVSTICCYPTDEDFIQAHADLIQAAYDKAGRPGPARLLFSAHGLPRKVIDAGDPYQIQVEATAKAVAEKLGEGWDWKVTYQSRVGPLEWIGPSTEDEIRAASQAGLSLVISPIAFVSEHIETLVELDHEYRQVAFENGCPVYVRAPTLSVQPGFIRALGRQVETALASSQRKTDCAWRCGEKT